MGYHPGMEEQNQRPYRAAPATARTTGFLHEAGKLWMALGHALHKLTSPLVLGLVYFAILTPLAVVVRLCGHDALGLGRRQRPSYWSDSRPLEQGSFRRQY
jgi:hypothetical protein